MLNEYLITIDVDWASDEIIDYVSNILLRKKVKATWFITHDSPSIRKLTNHPEMFELGLHPNFHNGSSQGSEPSQVMKYLRKILPHSGLVRTHGLVQSTKLLAELVDRFGVTVDLSVFLYNTPLITPHEIWFARGKNGLLRVPYFWEDDHEFSAPVPCWSFSDERYHCQGLKVFDFHPVHIALNSRDAVTYSTVKGEIGVRNLTLSKLESYVNREAGTRTLFMAIVDYLSRQKVTQPTIGDIARNWKETHE